MTNTLISNTLNFLQRDANSIFLYISTTALTSAFRGLSSTSSTHSKPVATTLSLFEALTRKVPSYYASAAYIIKAIPHAFATL